MNTGTTWLIKLQIPDGSLASIALPPASIALAILEARISNRRHIVVRTTTKSRRGETIRDYTGHSTPASERFPEDKIATRFRARIWITLSNDDSARYGTILSVVATRFRDRDFKSGEKAVVPFWKRWSSERIASRQLRSFPVSDPSFLSKS